MLTSDSDETNWLYLARKMRWRTLLGRLPSVRRKGNTLVIGVNRTAGCFGIGALIFAVVCAAFIVLQDPHDPYTWEFLQIWFLIVGGIGLIGCVAGFSRTGLYWEHGDARVAIRYGLFQWRRNLTVANLSADLVVAEKRLWFPVPRGHVMLVLRHENSNDVLPLASAPTRADLKPALDALTEILGTPADDRTATPLKTEDEKGLSISRASCSSGSSNYRTHVFRELSPDEAVFRPTLRAYFVAGLIIAVALGALGFMLPFAVLEGSIAGAIICLAGGGVFLLTGWAFVPGRMRFIVNRSAGTVAITGIDRDQDESSEPFSPHDIVAVQICSRREDSSSTASYTARELNLVLKNPAVQRINLLCYSNRRALFEDAERLADFLGKPLLDHSGEDAYRKT